MAARLRWVSESLQRGHNRCRSSTTIGHHVSDRQDRSHAVKRAVTRQYASSAVACRTWSSLRSHPTRHVHKFLCSATADLAVIAVNRRVAGSIWSNSRRMASLPPEERRALCPELCPLLAFLQRTLGLTRGAERWQHTEAELSGGERNPALGVRHAHYLRRNGFALVNRAGRPLLRNKSGLESLPRELHRHGRNVRWRAIGVARAPARGNLNV